MRPQSIRYLATLMLLLSFGLAPAVQAQDVYSDNSQQWWTNLEAQLTETLTSQSSDVQATTMQNILYFQQQHADRISFTEAAPRLLDIFETHSDKKFRVMALATLHAIGEKRSVSMSS